MENLISLIPETKSINGRVLLVYNFENQEEIIEYQLEMLANNNIPQILKSDVIRINRQIRLSFDITSLIPLKKFFERVEVGRKDFICIIKQLSSLLNGLEEYLLDYWRIVYKNEFIFINPQTLELGFVYLPAINIEDNGLESLKEFLVDNIIHNIRFKNEPSDNYVQRFLELLKTRELDYSLLKNYVDDMENQQNQRSRPALNFESFYNKPAVHKNTELRSVPEPSVRFPENNVVQKVNEKKEKYRVPAKSYIIMFSVVFALLILGAVLTRSGTLSFNNSDFLLSLFGYLLVCGALGYLVYSKLFAPYKNTDNIPQNDNSYANDTVQFNRSSEQYVNKNIKISGESRQASGQMTDQTHVQTNGSMNVLRNYQPEFNNYQQENDKTVFLDPGKINHPYLRRKNSSETIILSHFPFMFGRLEEQADYCLKNPAIGKLHAEITRESSEYFLTDMNSRNGTLLNGEYLTPGQSVKLNNGDVICFANEEFTFFC